MSRSKQNFSGVMGTGKNAMNLLQTCLVLLNQMFSHESLLCMYLQSVIMMYFSFCVSELAVEDDSAVKELPSTL